MKNYGRQRVLEPKDFFPVSAWSLDNSRKINDDEMRISIERIKLEEGNFRQLCNSCEYDEDRIKERIVNIIERRGKLHNQLTDSGGICCGTIEEIGKKYENKVEFNVGDKVIGIASLTSVPIYIKRIKSINFNYGQIEIEGYAIFFSTSPVIHMPKDIPEEMLLSAFEESGSIKKAGEIAKCGKKFLLLGSNLFNILMYAAAMRFENGVGCSITACMNFEETALLGKEKIRKLLKPYVDNLYIINMTSPIENYNVIAAEEFGGVPSDEELYDSSIICSNLMGMEAIGVLLTKNHGNLFFTNLINNYNLVLLCAESFGKNINTISLEEYTSDFPSFTEALIRRIKPKLEQIHKIYKNKKILHKYSENIVLDYKLKNIERVEGYAYGCKKTEQMLEEVINIAGYDCNVLILGETGVGKERILDIIHQNSARKGNACIKINCSAITENLAESEFFGYEKGAFTGAREVGKKGFFELANNGILFLDEVGDLPMGIQSKLLRVLQEGQFYRVGGEMPVNVNVRVICATNKNLRELVAKNLFREDLYYRLNICELMIQPLRKRVLDIEPLAKLFLEKYNNKYMLERQISIEAMEILEKYPWPGNVRELENVVHKLVINVKKNEIYDTDVKEILEKFVSLDRDDAKMNDNTSILGEIKDDTGHVSLEEILGHHEKAIIEDALHKYGTTRRAADALGISQSQIMRKKKKYDI